MIELTASVMLLLSIFYGPATADAKTTNVISPTELTVSDPSIVDGIALIAPIRNSKTVESDVREYFKDIPILAEIAKCESEFRHIGTNGEIIKGKVNRSDIGVMQINKYYHADEALKLGIFLETLGGNMAFARKLYDKYGTDPWQSSSGCWEKYATIAKR